MPIEKKKNTITVKTFFDGDQDATEIFVSLIADRVATEKNQKEIDYHENVIYNKGEETHAHAVLSSGDKEAHHE